jgi:hypothetical protein
MKNIPLTQRKFAIVDDEDYEWLVQWKWLYTSGGYAARRTKKIYMHREIMHTPSGMYTDHINGNKLDNRKCNLRICTNTENTRNQKMHKNNNSGYKGISWSQRNKKWGVSVWEENKHNWLGYFSSPVEAAKVYDKKAAELFGEFAKLNFPDNTKEGLL